MIRSVFQVKWNSLLLTSLVPECYSRFLSELTKQAQLSPELVFQYWPPHTRTEARYKDWTSCARDTVTRLLSLPCFLFYFLGDFWSETTQGTSMGRARIHFRGS